MHEPITAPPHLYFLITFLYIIAVTLCIIFYFGSRFAIMEFKNKAKNFIIKFILYLIIVTALGQITVFSLQSDNISIESIKKQTNNTLVDKNSKRDWFIQYTDELNQTSLKLNHKLSATSKKIGWEILRYNSLLSVLLTLILFPVRTTAIFLSHPLGAELMSIIILSLYAMKLRLISTIRGIYPNYFPKITVMRLIVLTIPFIILFLLFVTAISYINAAFYYYLGKPGIAVCSNLIFLLTITLIKLLRNINEALIKRASATTQPPLTGTTE